MSASRAAADTLFARFLGPRFSHLDIGTLHLAGGLEVASPAAQFAREAGVTELPSLVAWPDGLDSSQPAILSVGSSSGTEQREELLQSLQKLAVPSMPELTAANYFERCQPAADRPAGALCVLLLVPALATWSESTTHAYGTMRRLAIQGAVDGVQFAWLDSARHTGFADGLRSRDPAFRGEAAPADQPMVVALRAASARTGLRKVQAAQMFSGVGQLSEVQLSEWVADLRAETARAWGAARELPPLGGPVPPRVTTWLWAWMARGGWLIVGLVLGAVAVLIVYSEAIIKWAEKLRAQQPAGGGGRKPAPRGSEQPKQPHVEPPAHKRREQPGHAAGRYAARDADSEPAPASSSGGDSGADGHTSNGLPPGVVALTEHTIAEVLGGSANVLLFAVNAGKVDRASMDGLMRHFGARGRDGSDALRGSASRAQKPAATECARPYADFAMRGGPARAQAEHLLGRCDPRQGRGVAGPPHHGGARVGEPCRRKLSRAAGTGRRTGGAFYGRSEYLSALRARAPRAACMGFCATAASRLARAFGSAGFVGQSCPRTLHRALLQYPPAVALLLRWARQHRCVHQGDARASKSEMCQRGARGTTRRRGREGFSFVRLPLGVKRARRRSLQCHMHVTSHLHELECLRLRCTRHAPTHLPSCIYLCMCKRTFICYAR
eukprot:scaffold22854_cov132-Isochrysis_galbana.AAC.2